MPPSKASLCGSVIRSRIRGGSHGIKGSARPPTRLMPREPTSTGAYAEAEDDVSAMLSAVVSKVPVFGLMVGTYAAILSEADLSLAHVLGWIGMLTALAGAMLAVQQDDVKRMLAYSSMSQLGYIVTAIALMSHLGWVTALYLTANHLMTKGILFLVAAAIILRTGARTFADLGGLARPMPFTFAAAAIAIVAMSGLPPLAGFGGKWLLLSAMMEKGWYVPIAMGLLATFVGFLYMARFIQAIFLDPPKTARGKIAEAPAALLVSQYLLILGILVMSFFPKLLIVPISEAIDPYFASTLVWDGMSLEMIYGYWNPVPVMSAAVAVSALLFAVLWLLRRKSGEAANSQKAHPRLLRLLQAGLRDAHACLVEFLLGRGRRRLDSARRHNPANLHRQRPDLYVLCPLLLRRPLRGMWWLSLVPQATKAVLPPAC